MHRLTAWILYDSNTNVLICDKVFVCTPLYYLDWFERSYPNVPLNLDDVPFRLQFINVIQGTKPDRQK